MAIQLKKRHTTSCRETYAEDNPGKTIKAYDNSLKSCDCSWWAEGTLRRDGFIRQTTRESKLARAKPIAAAWEEAGTLTATPANLNPDPTDTHFTIEFVKAEFETGYITARNLAQGTVESYANLFGSLLKFTASRGIRFVDELSLGELQGWQKLWGFKPRTAAKRKRLLHCFFKFCISREWIDKDPSKNLGVAPFSVEPEEPFWPNEIPFILEAAAAHPRKNATTDGPHMEAHALLERNTGMRISDACAFTIQQLDAQDRVTFFPIKANGTRLERSVTIAIPASLASKLRALPVLKGKYLFITGKGSIRSATNNWRSKYDLVFKRAEKLMGREFTSHPHPHRFRHTFAVERLTSGMPIQTVADCLGHTDFRITLKYYRRWVPGLQEIMDKEVRKHFPSEQ